MTTILDGKALLEKITATLEHKINSAKLKYNKIPGLAVILVGDNPASKVYVARKEKMANKIGMLSKQIILPESASQNDVISAIQKLNDDDSINGILVQLPLPKGINTEEVLLSILPEKDVDGFHPVNMGKLFSGAKPYSYPCTPLGIIELLKEYKIPIAGKHAVVIGRSNIVGKPVGMMLMAENATVTMCHSKTPNIPEICKKADIIVVAIGKENFLQAEWVKEGSIVIDVGINRNEATGKLIGDADYNNVSKHTSHITPVPGGVGPMTIAMLLNNTYNLFENTLS